MKWEKHSVIYQCGAKEIKVLTNMHMAGHEVDRGL